MLVLITEGSDPECGVHARVTGHAPLHADTGSVPTSMDVASKDIVRIQTP